MQLGRKSRSPDPKSPQMLPPIICIGECLTDVPNSDQVWSKYHRGCTRNPNDELSETTHQTRRTKHCKAKKRNSVAVHNDKICEGSNCTDIQTVTRFLESNENFIESYVLENVPEQVIRMWLFKKFKKRAKTPRRERSIETGKLNETNKIIKKYLGNRLDEITNEQILWDICEIISAYMSVDGFNIYVPENNKETITVFFRDKVQCKSFRRVSMSRSTIPHVADALPSKTSKIYERIKDENFDKKDPRYLLLTPMTTMRDKVVVLEMYRNMEPFTQTDIDIMSSLTAWGCMTIHLIEKNEGLVRQGTLNEYMLKVAESIFQDMESLDGLIEKIMHFAQELVQAERASLFLVDSKSDELYATVFDIGIDKEECKGRPKKAKLEEIRFPIGTGIAGHVAQTGETLNISDAYADPRFNRSVDLQTGFITRNILCMPVHSGAKIIGVVQMVNKKYGEFTIADAEAFKMFSVYCGLALHNANLYSKIKRSEQKYKVTLEVLSYHNTCTEEEVQIGLKDLNEFDIEIYDDVAFNPFILTDYEKALTTVRMFVDLFQLFEFEDHCLMRFCLTVRKNYRRLPYHNWTHGFSVCNSIYSIITRQDMFTRNERLALFVASLCHDLDHRGKNNKYMLDTESPLAAMYSTSTMEYHHFNQTVLLLQQEGHNIFSRLSEDDYKEVLSLVKHCILATDLVVFFTNRSKLSNLVQKEKFTWEEKDHRLLAMAISMTAADLSAAAKPWHIQTETVRVIIQEFYEQGDDERKCGREPIPMMDRNRPEEQPSSQVGFLSTICIPCYDLLRQLMPMTYPLKQYCTKNLEKWRIIEHRIKSINQLTTSAEMTNEVLNNLIYENKMPEKYENVFLEPGEGFISNLLSSMNEDELEDDKNEVYFQKNKMAVKVQTQEETKNTPKPAPSVSPTSKTGPKSTLIHIPQKPHYSKSAIKCIKGLKSKSKEDEKKSSKAIEALVKSSLLFPVIENIEMSQTTEQFEMKTVQSVKKHKDQVDGKIIKENESIKIVKGKSKGLEHLVKGKKKKETFVQQEHKQQQTYKFPMPSEDPQVQADIISAKKPTRFIPWYLLYNESSHNQMVPPLTETEYAKSMYYGETDEAAGFSTPQGRSSRCETEKAETEYFYDPHYKHRENEKQLNRYCETSLLGDLLDQLEEIENNGKNDSKKRRRGVILGSLENIDEEPEETIDEAITYFERTVGLEEESETITHD